MSIKSIPVYTVEDHPNPEKVYEWVRNNWHHLNDNSVAEVVATLKAFATELGTKLDYCFGASPDRGQYIKMVAQAGTAVDEIFKRQDIEQRAARLLDQFRDSSDDCILTGCHWDAVLLQAIVEEVNPGKRLLGALHADTEYVYSDEGLTDFLEANQYFFMLDGSFISTV